MGFNATDLRKEAVTQGASTGDASLAGLAGTGTLQVWRGQHENVIDIIGTCRLPADSDGLGTLNAALEEQQPVTYDGPLEDPSMAGSDGIRTEVMVSSIGRYRLSSSDDDGTTYCLVNFVPAEPEKVAT